MIGHVDSEFTYPLFESSWWSFRFIPGVVTNCKVFLDQKAPAEVLQPKVAQVSIGFQSTQHPETHGQDALNFTFPWLAEDCRMLEVVTDR